MSRGSTYIVAMIAIAFIGTLLILAKWQDDLAKGAGGRLERIAVLADKAEKTITDPGYPPNAADQLAEVKQAVEAIAKIAKGR